MAMTPGSVTIAANGAETKSGFAGDYYDQLKAEWELALADMNMPVPTDPLQLARARVPMAKAANRAASIIQYVIDNAEAEVNAGGLQKTPNPNTADTATTAPAAPVYLPIV
jgi:hypothetical protein